MEKLIPMEKIARTYSFFLRALDSVYLHKVLSDYDLLYLYGEWPGPPKLVGDEGAFEPDVVYNALLSISEAVWSHYSEHDEIYTIYFSHPAMMKYYRLCRKYGRKRGVPLRENPYMKRAAEYVHSLLEQGCYTCSWHLQTKVNHKWASGVVFRMWPEFSGHTALLVLMAKIFRFYERELGHLKAELAAGDMPTLKKQREEAA